MAHWVGIITFFQEPKFLRLYTKDLSFQLSVSEMNFTSITCRFIDFGMGSLYVFVFFLLCNSHFCNAFDKSQIFKDSQLNIPPDHLDTLSGTYDVPSAMKGSVTE